MKKIALVIIMLFCIAPRTICSKLEPKKESKVYNAREDLQTFIAAKTLYDMILQDTSDEDSLNADDCYQTEQGILLVVDALHNSVPQRLETPWGDLSIENYHELNPDLKIDELLTKVKATKYREHSEKGSLCEGDGGAYHIIWYAIGEVNGIKLPNVIKNKHTKLPSYQSPEYARAKAARDAEHDKNGMQNRACWEKMHKEYAQQSKDLDEGKEKST